ncbi:hypothetical protein KUL118_37770 [Tenacibaculum sp. KUL118]|nr:hypothetical protein KUL118_37770 [Tenacibaculum sp. KUL118]
MCKSMPNWFKVLKHFDAKGYFYNGLTIPFLIGSSSVLNPNEPIIKIHDFISEIQDDSLSHKISLMKCHSINQYVIGVLDKESEAIMKSYKKPIYKVFNNFVITDSSFNKAQSIDDIIISLTETYQEILDNGNYSINDGVWSAYNSTDVQRLLEILDS